MSLEFDDGEIPIPPKILAPSQFLRDALRIENLRMNANDKDFLVIGTIENADAPAFGKAARGSPEEIMLQLLGARLFEAEDLAPLRIDSGHDVTDGSVLAGGVDSLKNQEKGLAVGRVMEVLQATQLGDMGLEKLPVPLFGATDGLHQRGPFLKLHFSMRDAEIL